MLILSVRTDNPEAEVGLFDGEKQLGYETWPAHRALSITIHQKINDLLATHNKGLADISGIVGFQGPGSFTGLRIGLTVADTLAYGLQIPIVATMGEAWVQKGIAQLHAGEDDKLALPHYGAPVHITLRKK